MTEQYNLIDNPNLEITRHYLQVLGDVCLNPYNHNAAARLSEVDRDMADLFMQYPESVWDLSKGFQPVTLSDGVLHSRERVLQEGGVPRPGALAGSGCSVLITLGERIPKSRALARDEYDQAYALLGHVADRLSDDEPKFRGFMYNRIRRMTFRNYAHSRGGHNYTQLDNDTLEGNLKETLKVVGFPLGVVGRLAVLTQSVMPREPSRVRYGDGQQAA